VKEFYRESVFLFLLFQFSLAATAQQIENLSSSFDGHKVIITYDLIYADSSRRFEVALFWRVSQDVASKAAAIINTGLWQ